MAFGRERSGQEFVLDDATQIAPVVIGEGSAGLPAVQPAGLMPATGPPETQGLVAPGQHTALGVGSAAEAVVSSEQPQDVRHTVVYQLGNTGLYTQLTFVSPTEQAIFPLDALLPMVAEDNPGRPYVMRVVPFYRNPAVHPNNVPDTRDLDGMLAGMMDETLLQGAPLFVARASDLEPTAILNVIVHDTGSTPDDVPVGAIRDKRSSTGIAFFSGNSPIDTSADKDPGTIMSPSSGGTATVIASLALNERGRLVPFTSSASQLMEASGETPRVVGTFSLEQDASEHRLFVLRGTQMIFGTEPEEDNLRALGVLTMLPPAAHETYATSDFKSHGHELAPRALWDLETDQLAEVNAIREQIGVTPYGQLPPADDPTSLPDSLVHPQQEPALTDTVKTPEDDDSVPGNIIDMQGRRRLLSRRVY